MFSHGHPVDSESFSEKTLPHCSAAFVISSRAIMSVLSEILYSVPCYHLSILAPILYFLNYHNFVVVVIQSLSHVWLFVTPWTTAHQASLSFKISRSLPKFMSIELVMPSNHLILCCPLLLLPPIFSIFIQPENQRNWIPSSPLPAKGCR